MSARKSTNNNLGLTNAPNNDLFKPMINWLTPSRRFALFWLALIAGTIIGKLVPMESTTLLWLFILWAIIAISGQKEAIEIFAGAVSATMLGAWLWQVTGGESWLNLNWLGGVSAHLLTWRDELIDRMFYTLPEPHGSLLAGILLGNRLKLDESLLEIFRIVGLSHLIAASGQNLTILTANARTILQPALGRRSFFAALLVVAVYIILTGAPASILRAGLMISLVLLGQYLGRPSRSLNGLILAAGLLTIFQPKIVFDIGFQLSLAATYGLIRVSPMVKRLIPRSWPDGLSGVISESLAATLMTTPLIVLYFERLSLVSPVINLIVVPTIPLLMALGLITSMILFVWPLLGQVAVWLTWPILAGIIYLSEQASSLPYAATDLTLPALAIISFMALLFFASEYLSWRSWLVGRRIEQ